MCACRRCRPLLALGLAAGVVVGHEAPHDHVVAAGAQAVAPGKVAIVRGTTGNAVNGSAALAVHVAVSGRGTVTPPPP